MTNGWKIGAAALALGILAGCTSDEAAVEEAVEAPAGESAPAEAAAPAEGEPAAESAEPAAESAEPAAPSSDEAGAASGAPEAAPEAPAATGDGLYVTTSLLNVRSGPGMSHPVVRVIRFQEQVQERGRHRLWVQIGEGEWVSSLYLSAAAPSAPQDPAAGATGASSPAPEAAPAPEPEPAAEPEAALEEP